MVHLLALVAGKNVPSLTVLPSRLIGRGSVAPPFFARPGPAHAD
jgi:hypothetical protein